MEFLLLTSGDKRRSQRDTVHTQQAIHAAPLGWFFPPPFFSAFLSCWLQKTGQVWIRGGSAGWGVSILLALFLSLSSICIFRCSVERAQRGGSNSALQMNAFSILVEEEWEWLNQAEITARLMRMEPGSRSEDVERWRRREAGEVLDFFFFL